MLDVLLEFLEKIVALFYVLVAFNLGTDVLIEVVLEL